MTIQEFYRDIEGDFEEVSRRIKKETLVTKFACMYKRDDSFDLLDKAFSDRDMESAFRAVHTLKGVAMNIGFSKLAKVSSDLTEFLRECNSLTDMETSKKYLAEVRSEHEKVLHAISMIDM